LNKATTAGQPGTPLSVVVGDYDRTRGLLDGTVQVPGFDTRVSTGDLEEIFAKAFSSAEHEVTELSFSNFLIASTRRACPYLALPIFPSRSFRHSALYVRAGSGIASPRDLAGKRIGTREYSNTLSLVARGILMDEYGYVPGSSDWVVGDVDHIERDTIDNRNWPARGLSIRGVAGRTLSTMLAEGELDALIAYTPPENFGRDDSLLRLFPHWRVAEQDYFRRTRRFPIMHVMGIRRDVAERHPELPAALVQAFNAAKAQALALLAVHQALPVMLPWMTAEAEATQALMGADFWPYGLEANRDMLETQIRWSFEQGLIARQPALEELFASAGAV
jgi:4,5-dihydroxyphthalate decarboxylase